MIYFTMIFYVLIQGEKAKEKDKDKHSSTSSVSSKSSVSSAGTTNGGSQQNNKTEPTWVHDIFEGILTNETRCLCCETVSEGMELTFLFPRSHQLVSLLSVFEFL